MVVRSFGKQFAGATQLLPTGLSEDQNAAALEAFCKAYATMYFQIDQTPKLPKDTFRWQQFRQPTKNLLTALCNSLVQMMPPGFSLQKCVPRRVLIPRGNQSDRFRLDEAEKKMLRLEDWTRDCSLHFCWNYSTQTSWLDFPEKEPELVKLCFSADEGTEDWG